MAKIKILSVGECSYLHSGYGRYNHGLLTELHKNPRYDIYEFGLSYNPTYNQANTIAWKFCPNVLPQHRVIDSTEKMQEWKDWFTNPVNSLGGPLFNQVLLEIQPDIVIANQDEWNLRYMIDSPFRRFFKLICLFACDAPPQKLEWIESMSRCDAVLTYSDWAKELIEKQSPKVKVISSVPPSCQTSFQPLDKKLVRESFGISPDAKIIGTVMRNQIRKLFPSLFKSFKAYLDKTGEKNTWLWIHSKYPDSSWKFPELLMEYEVFDRVIFTYTCTTCKNTFSGLYSDAVQCTSCKEMTGNMVGTNTGISSEDLCRVYNCFDLYVQYSNSEGWGIPTVESAACAVPSMVVNYSALEDAVRYLYAEPIPVLEISKEIYTSQDRAIPDEKAFVEMLYKFFKKPAQMRKTIGLKARQGFEQKFGWEKTAKSWSNAIDSVYSPTNWRSPLQISNPAEPTNQQMNNVDYARWLIAEVACTPERLNSVYENQIIRNLIFQCRADIVSNGIGAEYNREIAYNEFKAQGDFRRRMEQLRGQVLGL